MVRKVLLAGAALLLAGAASAQLPPEQDVVTQPVPDAAPNYTPYGTPVTISDARKLIATAMAEAKKRDWHLACAVVEPSGTLVAYEKMDDTQYGSAEVSIAKAKSAALYRRPTRAFADAVKAGNAGALSLPGAIAVEGGLPIAHGGKVIGGMGCSGAASNQDATVVYKAIEEFK